MGGFAEDARREYGWASTYVLGPTTDPQRDFGLKYCVGAQVDPSTRALSYFVQRDNISAERAEADNPFGIPFRIHLGFGEVPQVEDRGQDYDGSRDEPMSEVELQTYLDQMQGGRRMRLDEVDSDGKVYNVNSLRYVAHTAFRRIVEMTGNLRERARDF